MSPFYLRVEDSAVLIGDRDLFITPITAGKFSGSYELSAWSTDGDVSDKSRIFVGTNEQCQLFMDWLLNQKQFVNSLDSRNFLKGIE